MTQSENAVIGYLRVSTEEQSNSGLGVAAQRTAIEAEATRRGWDQVEFVTDLGYSAKDLRRPGITDALTNLKAGRAGVLVVAKLDRLSRSLLDFAGLMERAKREGWQLVVLDIAIDTTTPSGQLMANVMASFAEYERQLIGQRTKAALDEKRSLGMRLGRPSQTPDSVLARIQAERGAGSTLRAISDGLNDDGVPTVRGGSRWYPSTVAAALRTANLDEQATRLSRAV